VTLRQISCTVPGINMALVFGASIDGPVNIVKGVEDITRYKNLPVSHCGTLSNGIATAIGTLACSENMNPCFECELSPMFLSSMPCSFSSSVDKGIVPLSDIGSKDEFNVGITRPAEGCVLPRFGVMSLALTFFEKEEKESAEAVVEFSCSLASKAYPPVRTRSTRITFLILIEVDTEVEFDVLLVKEEMVEQAPDTNDLGGE